MSLSSFFGLDHTDSERKIRYAVVGLGDISQAAMLPGIHHTGNSIVTALVTGDPEKAKDLKEKYDVKFTYSYDDFPKLLASGEIDAIYLATPNWLHADFAAPALRAGIHVLLEKPMEISSTKCREILDAQKTSTAKLMVAYRLHFEPATLAAIKAIRAGDFGTLKIFNSTFSQLVDPKNHRAQNGVLAGPLYDMGPYPINAARYLFGEEPIEVISAVAVDNANHTDKNMQDSVAVVLRFPQDRLAQFVVSYAASSVDQFTLAGTNGSLTLEPSFGYGKPKQLKSTVEEKIHIEKFAATDQFGGEMRYFSYCILNDLAPEPDGEEGFADVRIIEAIERAIESGQPQKLEPWTKSRLINPESQLAKLSAVSRPAEVNASAPSLN